MHLCIFSDTVTTNVTGITLKDGYLPSIGDYIHSSADVFLDPAVWIKVQVLDVVSVDCSRRQLSWEVSRPEDNGPATSKNRAEDGEDSASKSDNDAGVLISVCAEEFLDLDEVFDSLPVLVVNYQTNEMTKSQFSEAIVKMLHLYILPNVYLSSTHVPTLRNALKSQLSVLQAINDEIDRSSQKFEAVSQAKRKLRQKFVSEFAEDEAIVFSSPVMAQLASDIDGDIREISGTLEVAQDIVNRNKRDGGDNNDSQWELVSIGLAEARSSRDDVMRCYEALLDARENILQRKSLMESVAQKRRRTLDLKLRDQPEHRIYAELSLLQTELVAMMRSLTDRKLMAASVRESLARTLDELEKGGESSFGEEVDGGGIVNGNNNDVVDNRASKSWMTLAEQVRWLLSCPGHPVKVMHDQFCACVIARCRAAFSERIMYVTSFGGEMMTTPSTPIPRRQESGVFQPSSSSDGDGERSPDACRIVVPFDNGQSLITSSLPSPSSPDCASNNRRSRGGLFARMAGRKKDSVAGKSTASPPPPPPQGKAVNFATGSPSSTTLCLLDSTCDDAVMIFNEETDYAKRAIETLKRDIACHFETVTELLRAELKQKSKTSIWLSYEGLFYDETIDDILTLYSLEYNSVTRMLGQSIRLLTVGDLKFEDSILVNMLEDHVVDDDGESNLKEEEKNPGVQLQNGTTQDHEDDFETGCRRTRSSSESEFLDKLSYVVNNSEVNVEDLIPRLSFIMGKDANTAVAAGQSLSARELNARRRKSVTPATVRKSIKVNHVLKTSIVYDRTICCSEEPAKTNAVSSSSSSRMSGFFSPKKPLKHVGGSGSSKVSDHRKTTARTMTLRSDLKPHFRSAFRCLSTAVETRQLSAKFQQLTRCLREVSEQISAFSGRLRGFRAAKETGCDELMDGLIVLLSNLDESLLSQLYIQIVMLIDLMPPFFKCNSFNFALVQFYVAFQFLEDQILLKRSRSGNDDVTS